MVFLILKIESNALNSIIFKIYFYYIFHDHLSPFFSPHCHNPHTVVLESFFLFVQSLHPQQPHILWPQERHPALCL